MPHCDVLIRADWLLPIAPENCLLREQGIALDQGKICALGAWPDVSAEYAANTTHHWPNHVVMPGLVNAHGHAAMSLLRGAGEDLPLQAWLNERVWPLEARVMNEHYTGLGTQLAIAEMLRSGTTTFADMYFFPETVARVSEANGIRCQLAFPIIEFANAWSENVDRAIQQGAALFDQYHTHSLVDIAFGPHAAYSVQRQELIDIAEAARQRGARIHIHLHENAAEVAAAKQQTGQSWLALAHDIGLLGPDLQAVHMTQITPEEQAWVAASDTKVIHCPKSNAKLASGYCRWIDMDASGVTVGIGTDGAASNNRLNLFEELHFAALLAKHDAQDASAAPAPRMLQMATLDGARCLGLDDRIGSIEVGKDADLIAVDMTTLGSLPSHDPYAALVHGASGQAVTQVYVRGEPLIADGEFTRIDWDALTSNVQHWYDSYA